MKIKSSFLCSLHLDSSYCLLSVKSVALLLEYFKALDIREEMALDGSVSRCNTTFYSPTLILDIQFDVFMSNATDLSHDQIYKVFDMLDVDRSGLIDFDEFYLLVCILISINVGLYHVLNTY